MKTNAQRALEAFSQKGSIAVIAARGRMGAMLMHEGELAGLGMAGFNRPFDSDALKGTRESENRHLLRPGRSL